MTTGKLSKVVVGNDEHTTIGCGADIDNVPIDNATPSLKLVDGIAQIIIGTKEVHHVCLDVCIKRFASKTLGNDF